MSTVIDNFKKACCRYVATMNQCYTRKAYLEKALTGKAKQVALLALWDQESSSFLEVMDLARKLLRKPRSKRSKARGRAKSRKPAKDAGKGRFRAKSGPSKRPPKENSSSQLP